MKIPANQGHNQRSGEMEGNWIIIILFLQFGQILMSHSIKSLVYSLQLSTSNNRL